MKKLAISLLIAVVALLAGCVGYGEPLPEPVMPTQPANSSNAILPDEPPSDITWISPGKVQVGNFYPGARAEWNITIHNGKDTECSFAVTYRYPDHVGEGYNKPTINAEYWVIVADPTPLLMPKETRDILIALDMPETASSPGDKWEFWVSVKDTSQTGMMQTELCTRWLVSMR